MDSTKEAKMQEFHLICKSNGLKLTHQRLQIFNELLDSYDHPSVDTLYQRLKPKMPTISIDTIYRTLMTFQEFGLIKKLDTWHSQARFDARTHDHHHIICNNCGRIDDFTWQEFDSLQLPEGINNSANVLSKSATVHGICRECLTNESKQHPKDTTDSLNAV